jgi:hypothetical protein
MQAQEYEPGRWVIFDLHERPFGMIDFIRRGDEVGYRATLWAQEPEKRELIGYYRNLRAAAAAIHLVKINVAVPRGHPADIIIERRYPEHRPGYANTPARTERDQQIQRG